MNTILETLTNHILDENSVFVFSTEIACTSWQDKLLNDEIVEAIPLEKILLETDCPYMAPEPYRGKRNSSLYLTYVRDRIAEIKGVSPEEVERVTEENARHLFAKVK